MRPDMLFAAVVLLAYLRLVKRYGFILEQEPGVGRSKFGNLSIPFLLCTSFWLKGLPGMLFPLGAILLLLLVRRNLKLFLAVVRPHYFIMMLTTVGLWYLWCYLEGAESYSAALWGQYYHHLTSLSAASGDSLSLALANSNFSAALSDSNLDSFVGSSLSSSLSSSLNSSLSSNLSAVFNSSNDLSVLMAVMQVLPPLVTGEWNQVVAALAFSPVYFLALLLLLSMPIGLCALYFMLRQLIGKNRLDLRGQSCLSLFIVVVATLVITQDKTFEFALNLALPALFYYVISSYRALHKKSWHVASAASLRSTSSAVAVRGTTAAISAPGTTTTHATRSTKVAASTNVSSTKITNVSAPNATAPNATVSNVVATDATAPNTTVSNVVATDATAPNTAVPNTMMAHALMPSASTASKTAAITSKDAVAMPELIPTLATLEKRATDTSYPDVSATDTSTVGTSTANARTTDSSPVVASSTDTRTTDTSISKAQVDNSSTANTQISNTRIADTQITDSSAAITSSSATNQASGDSHSASTGADVAASAEAAEGNKAVAVSVKSGDIRREVVEGSLATGATSLVELSRVGAKAHTGGATNSDAVISNASDISDTTSMAIADVSPDVGVISDAGAISDTGAVSKAAVVTVSAWHNDGSATTAATAFGTNSQDQPPTVTTSNVVSSARLEVAPAVANTAMTMHDVAVGAHATMTVHEVHDAVSHNDAGADSNAAIDSDLASDSTTAADNDVSADNHAAAPAMVVNSGNTKVKRKRKQRASWYNPWYDTNKRKGFASTHKHLRGLEIVGAGHFIMGLRPRTERMPLPWLLQLALFVPLALYISGFVAYSLYYDKLNTLQDPLFGVSLGVMAFMSIVALFFLVGRLFLFSLASLGGASLIMSFLLGLIVPQFNSYIGLGRETALVSQAVDHGFSRKVCVYNYRFSDPGISVLDPRLQVYHSKEMLHQCDLYHDNIILTRQGQIELPSLTQDLIAHGALRLGDNLVLPGNATAYRSYLGAGHKVSSPEFIKSILSGETKVTPPPSLQLPHTSTETAVPPALELPHAPANSSKSNNSSNSSSNSSSTSSNRSSTNASNSNMNSNDAINE